MAGNVFIVESEERFQKVSYDILFNEKVDTLTIGVYTRILALGKKWHLNVKGLSTQLHITERKVRTALNQLEELGYLKRVLVQDKKTGVFEGYDYYFGMTPFPEDERTNVKKAHTPILTKTHRMDSPEDGLSVGRIIHRMEKCEDILIDDNRVIEEKDNKTLSRGKSSKFVRPTLEEVTQYCEERKNGISPEAFLNFYDANGWVQAKNKPIKDWKAAVRTWEDKRKNEQKATSKSKNYDYSSFDDIYKR